MAERDELAGRGPAGRVILAVVGAALVGGVAAASIIASSKMFPGAMQKAPLLLAWVGLLAALGAMSWAGFVPAVAACVQSWKAVGRPNAVYIGLTFAAIAGIIILNLVLQPRVFPMKDVTWPLGDDQPKRVAIMSIVVLIPPFAAIVAMWLTASLAHERAIGAKATPATISEHLELRDRLQSLLWYCGTVVGGAVLTTGMLRQSMLDGKYATETAYPPALVLAYGAFFTFLLVICYVPAYLLTQRAGKRLLHDALGDNADLASWKEEREKLSELLHLDVGIDTSLKDTIAILAPLVAGVVPLALPG